MTDKTKVINLKNSARKLIKAWQCPACGRLMSDTERNHVRSLDWNCPKCNSRKLSEYTEVEI